MNIRLQLSGLLLLAVTYTNGQTLKKDIVKLDVLTQLEYCKVHTANSLAAIPNDGKSIPRSVPAGNKDWNYVDYKDWTSGFWPGQLWFIYETTNDKKWAVAADKYTQYLLPLTKTKAADHDLGFQVFNSFGVGYQLTGKKEYKEAVLRTADTLATLFNPKVGTLQSWPHNDYGGHNTIIDNMMNLEMLFWASKHGGDKKLYKIAVKHAETTMQNHFKPDYSAYHVVVYDSVTGKKIKAVTAQGYSDESMWARGQAWAIYGFTMVYRETGDRKFLDFAHKITRVYLDRLPADLIPYWDFNAPDIPAAPRDASAAAITASALLELATFTRDRTLKREYEEKAMKMITELTAHYQSRYANNALLMHSTGHKPANGEIDSSIIYADYYYLECLVRLEKLRWVKRFF
ncbi:glycoside hydrolase family 88 protein [Flavobacterium sp. DG1-102-2]|uniref:glycoside hydrolase family 88 protein n=1 Tax=Flavobacterium sp. DG1-102-2 TaxID=3081663 RepID=UPI00294934BD|nr:glycoside hydrolase family 88 protein [Flavobacterium sp. DG1-102-2]MDV6167424.1 glycoside hydrolase family 88 protein [Flavobacterium sp. DG1-102-2]